MADFKPVDDASGLLRRALSVDGLSSGLSGLAAVAFPGPIAALMGFSSPRVVAAVGVSLLLFAAGVLLSARRSTPSRGEAVVIVALNVAWIAGSAVVIAAGWLTTAGNWGVALMADAVMLFAVLETIGLRRI